ncbi:MAG TPA: response regulator [Candidatus Ozemobacteraceae bacterium]|nr:response regulator [Candidatus Ozemobacteraceae bacterium]
MKILVLEDDPFRISIMKALLKKERIPFSICPDPIDFLVELTFKSAETTIISLDHDLSRIVRPCGIYSFDCGCAVVRFMSRMKPVCPVLVHSRNDQERLRMIEDLTGAGWLAQPVIEDPTNETNWVESAWIEAIRTMHKNGENNP